MNLKVLENQFSVPRFSLLLQRELVHHYKTLTTAFGFGLGVLLLLSILSVAGANTWNFHQTFFPLVLFWGGYIVTSMAFTEIHRAPRNYFYLTLPASPLEKYVSKLFLTSVGYILGALAGYFLFSLLVTGINFLLFRITLPVFNPFQADVWLSVRTYFVTQSLFMFGALFFKKTHFIKTVLSIITFFFVLTFIMGIVFSIVFFDYIQTGMIGKFHFSIPFSGQIFQQFAPWGNVLSTIFSILFWVLLAPFFWVLGYLRLKESEARDGV
jgi:hypothetical protein